MAHAVQPRTKDHWSVRLHVKRPGGMRIPILVAVVVQTVLLLMTTSSLATGGGLYGCSSACGTADKPATPAIAVLFGIVMLLLPLVIGALCAEWRLGVALAVLPLIPALLITSSSLLAPTNTIIPPTPAKGAQPAVPYPTSHFGPPFVLDPTHLGTLFFSFALFAFLGWLGWMIGSAIRDA